jgi:hypothetical protein
LNGLRDLKELGKLVLKLNQDNPRTWIRIGNPIVAGTSRTGGHKHVSHASASKAGDSGGRARVDLEGHAQLNGHDFHLVELVIRVIELGLKGRGGGESHK